jgi:excinuclease ABC subunit A
VIEHNLDVTKTADWIIDLGPEGGAGGGKIIAQGPPEHVAGIAESYTGRYLKLALNRRASRRAPVPIAAPVRNGRERKQPADLLGE